MSIVNDCMDHGNTEAELAEQWQPESDGESWEPDGLDDPIGWLPTDCWFDRQAEIFEAMGSDVADFAACWFRETAKAFRALDATTIEEYAARAETYPV